MPLQTILFLKNIYTSTALHYLGHLLACFFFYDLALGEKYHIATHITWPGGSQTERNAVNKILTVLPRASFPLKFCDHVLDLLLSNIWLNLDLSCLQARPDDHKKINTTTNKQIGTIITTQSKQTTPSGFRICSWEVQKSSQIDMTRTFFMQWL